MVLLMKKMSMYIQTQKYFIFELWLYKNLTINTMNKTVTFVYSDKTELVKKIYFQHPFFLICSIIK